VSDVRDPVPLPEGLDIPAADWQQTPVSVRLVVLTLLTRRSAPEQSVERPGQAAQDGVE
jgi:hypothetical protein